MWAGSHCKWAREIQIVLLEKYFVLDGEILFKMLQNKPWFFLRQKLILFKENWKGDYYLSKNFRAGVGRAL